jgi:transcriptional regulator with XRE-family HTH domain
MVSRHPALKNLGLNLRRQRGTRSLTQEGLAEKANLDPTYISGIERGVRNPSVLSVVRLARALEVTLSDLCRGIDV